MELFNIRCPECRAWLKAKTNFTAGEKVNCPKCETPFTVKEPAESDALTATTQNRKTQAEREFLVGSSGHSLVWYATFALLIGGMVALGFVIAQKLPENRVAEKPNFKNDQPPIFDGKQPDGKQPDGKQPKGKQPGGKQPGGKQPKGKQPDGTPPDGKQPDGKQPPEKAPNPKPAGPGGALGFGPLGALFGSGTPMVPAADREKLMQKYKTAIVGTWTADLGKGATEELAYAADGTYTTKLTGPDAATASGKYTVKELVGTKSLKIQLDSADGARTVIAVFEDDELQHPSLQKGVTGTFRKK